MATPITPGRLFEHPGNDLAAFHDNQTPHNSSRGSPLDSSGYTLAAYVLYQAQDKT